MRSSLNLLEFTEECIHAHPSPSSRTLWPDLKTGFYSADELRKTMHINGATGSNRSAWDGEESPVSVIGHAARSNNINRSGSASMEQPSTNGFSPPRTHPAINSSPTANWFSNQHSNFVPLDAPDLNSASNYAESLSQRVQQAFRKSHELQTPSMVKTWPISPTSKRMAWLSLQADPPFINAGEPSKVFDNLKSRSTAAAAADTNVTHVDDQQTSSEDDIGLLYTAYTSSRKDNNQDDEEDDSLIDFFPATSRSASAVIRTMQSTIRRCGSKDRFSINEKMRAEECTNANGTSCIMMKADAPLMRMKIRSSCRGVLRPCHHADEDEGSIKVSTSYKWDDAERWLTAASGTCTSTSTTSISGPMLQQQQQQLYQLTSVDVAQNRDGPVKAAGHCPQLVQVQAHKPLSDNASTQDKHVADQGQVPADSILQHSAMREAATQSTPVEWSSCNSPAGEEERAIITLRTSDIHFGMPSLGPRIRSEQQHYSTEPDKELAHTQKASPPRHNTPARRSFSCSRSRINAPDCALSSCKSGKQLNLRELESCHLDKLKLAQDIPLGTSSTWQLFAEDEAADMSCTHEKLLEHCKSPLTTSSEKRQHGIYMSKVNMLEARVSAWEDVERAKHLAKFKRDEAKIEAWESLQHAEADAELRKLEVKLEKMRFEGREKIMGKLAGAQKRAQDMRRVVEAQKVEQLTRVAMRANHIRKSGHFPSSAFNVMCSLTTKIKPSSNLSFS